MTDCTNPECPKAGRCGGECAMTYDDTETMETARERLDATSYGLIRVLQDLCDKYGYRGVLRTLEDLLEEDEVDSPPYTHVFRDEWNQPIGTIDRFETNEDGVTAYGTLNDAGLELVRRNSGWAYSPAGEKSGEEVSSSSFAFRGVVEPEPEQTTPAGWNVDLSKLKTVLDNSDSCLGSYDVLTNVDERDPVCVEKWPECCPGEIDPRCCQFPKGCLCLLLRGEKTIETVTENEPNDCGEDPFDQVPMFSLNTELDEAGERKIIEEIKQLFREQFERLKNELQQNNDIEVKATPDVDYQEVLAQMSYPCQVDLGRLIIRSTWPITDNDDLSALVYKYYTQPAIKWSTEFNTSDGFLVSVFIEPREGDDGSR